MMRLKPTTAGAVALLVLGICLGVAAAVATFDAGVAADADRTAGSAPMIAWIAGAGGITSIIVAVVVLTRTAGRRDR